MLRCAVLAIVVLVLMKPAVAADRRVALVIGNSKYVEAGNLPNATNDARAVSAAFKKLGFEDVQMALDGDLKSMQSALATFARKADGADLALVYYSGHGIEVDGRNYLLPVDAKLVDAADVDFEAVPLDLAVAAADRAKSTKIIVLDACRNNPFRARMVRRQSRRSIGQGLAPVAPATGTLIAYAAKGGTEADDGPSGGNSPFTQAFLKYVMEPQIEVRLLFGKIRDDVVRVTGRQEPFIYGSLGGEEVFLGGRTPLRSMPPDGTAKETAPSGSVSEAAQAWALLKDTSDLKVLDAFRRQFGNANPFYDQLAANRMEQLSLARSSATKGPTNPGAQSPPSNRAFYFVGDTRPPDAYLTLRTEPGGSAGQRILDMPNGTLLDVLEKRSDGWWRVKIVNGGREGWALNRAGNRVWIHCCRAQ